MTLRTLLITLALAAGLGAESDDAATTPVKALPVDPSELTPDSGLEPVDPTPPPPEAKPLPPGEIELGPYQRQPHSDSPLLSDPVSRDDAVRLQIFLDESHFGPGVIDGKPGRFTLLAVDSWNEVHGHPPGSLDAVLAAARDQVESAYATAIVPRVARKWVNTSLSYKKSQQAEAKRMSYRSYAEFMAERYHSDVDFLIELNGSSTTWGLAPGKPVVVPNVTPFLVEKLSGARYEAEELLESRHVVIDTDTNQLRIFDHAPRALVVTDPEQPLLVKANRALIASFPITPGQERFIKYGQWELRNAVELPVWRYDPSLLKTGKRGSYSLNIPPGPNSPVGIIWMGLSVPGIGMHGTSDPETIGRARSAGCIRLANWDAIRLPDFIRPGASVEIR